MKNHKKQHNSILGFSLLEILICMSILLVLFLSSIGIYVNCQDIQTYSRNSTIALSEAQEQIEVIKSLVSNIAAANYTNNFLSIVPTFNGQVSGLPTMNGVIRTEAQYVDEAAIGQRLISIRVVVAWKQNNGRIIGEAQVGAGGDLVFSDLNGNGIIESPVVLVTAISYKR